MTISEKVYVKVKADFEKDGVMIPCEITWDDGRRFQIDEVVRIMRGQNFQPHGSGDRFTVIIHGKTRQLYFERSENPGGPYQGRWWVEYRSYA